MSSESQSSDADAGAVERLPLHGALWSGSTREYQTSIWCWVLGAGLLRGTVVMVIGPPGTGKTILAQQVAFRAATRGETALYFTGYSEIHGKLLAHNRSLEFFAPETIGTDIQMSSLPDLMEQGSNAARQAIVSTLRQQDASLVVLDGFRSIRGFLPDDQAAAAFLYSLGAMLALLGTTLLVLVEGDATDRIRDP